MKINYTKTACTFLFLIMVFNAFPQSGWDTLPWKSYADFRLQPLNKSYVTTGVLYDRMFPIAHMDEHTGLSTTEDTTSSAHFKQGYYEMYNSIYNPTGINTPDDLENMLDTFPAWNGHPIGILYYKFNSLDTNALQDHLLDTLSNGQFIDVANRPRSPYFTNTAFLASPLIADDEVFTKGEHTFFIDPRFFLQNAGAHIEQIRIDFGDGQGEWIVNNPFDSAGSFMKGNGTQGITSFITKTIGGTAIGRIVVVLVDLLGYRIVHSNPFKITVPGGKGPNDYATLTTCKGGFVPADRWVIEAPQARLNPINAIYGNPQLNYSTKTVQPCPGFPTLGCKVTVPVKDTAYFYFADNGTGCNRNVLKKPIVFIDGFDPTNSRGVKQIYEDYINKRVKRSGGDVAFGDYMLTQGYDFIILDYKHGNDLMERNALTLVSLLERLYQVYGSTFEQDITLIGPSMGSEVAQYALAYMEHNNIPHHVKTYISFDGPQQGANVPIGLQNMVEYLTKRGLLSKLKPIKSLIRDGLYNGLAARQLLAHHVSANATFPTPDALRTKFLNNLQAVGEYPVLCRKVALINGLSDGTKNPDHLTNNESLLHIINKRRGWKSLWGACNWNVCKNLDWEAKAAPSTGTAKISDMWTLNAIINLIFWVPPFETTKSASAAWGNSSLDNAPGSRFGPLFNAEPGNINEDKIRFLAKELFYLLTGSKRTTFTQNLNNFSFVPSYSAADLRFPSMTNNSSKNLYMNWSQTNLCGHTPFDYVYAPTTENERHVFVSQQGSEWFEAEAKCTVANLPVLVSPINGAGTLCLSENYSVSFCKTTNHTTTWKVSDPSIATIIGGGDQITLKAASYGQITLTATITFGCSINGAKPFVTRSIPISVGTKAPSYISNFNNGKLFAQNTEYNFSSDGTDWKVSGGTIISGQGTQNITVLTAKIVRGGNIIFNMNVRANGVCGFSQYIFRTGFVVAGTGGTQIIISPNPATDFITVSFNTPTQVKLENTETKFKAIFKIKITSVEGQIKKELTFNKGVPSAKVLLTGLVQGTYILSVFDGNFWSTQKIIIH